MLNKLWNNVCNYNKQVKQYKIKKILKKKKQYSKTTQSNLSLSLFFCYFFEPKQYQDSQQTSNEKYQRRAMEAYSCNQYIARTVSRFCDNIRRVNAAWWTNNHFWVTRQSMVARHGLFCQTISQSSC